MDVAEFDQFAEAYLATHAAFFPGPLARLRPLERHLGNVPLGAQHYTLAQA